MKKTGRRIISRTIAAKVTICPITITFSLDSLDTINPEQSLPKVTPTKYRVTIPAALPGEKLFVSTRKVLAQIRQVDSMAQEPIITPMQALAYLILSA